MQMGSSRIFSTTIQSCLSKYCANGFEDLLIGGKKLIILRKPLRTRAKYSTKMNHLLVYKLSNCQLVGFHDDQLRRLQSLLPLICGLAIVTNLAGKSVYTCIHTYMRSTNTLSLCPSDIKT